MQIETVAVFNHWDFDHERRELRGMNVHMLNAIDRIEFARSFPPNYVVDKRLFDKENWFDEAWRLMLAREDVSQQPYWLGKLVKCNTAMLDLFRAGDIAPITGIKYEHVLTAAGPVDQCLFELRDTGMWCNADCFTPVQNG